MSASRDAGRVMRHVMCAFTAAFLVAALLAPDREAMLDGFGRMLFAPSQLTRDYFLQNWVKDFRTSSFGASQELYITRIDGRGN